MYVLGYKKIDILCYFYFEYYCMLVMLFMNCIGLCVIILMYSVKIDKKIGYCRYK